MPMRQPCTFGSLFDDYLKELLVVSRDADEIVGLVAVLEGRDEVGRQISFGEWLSGELFLCERCGHEFSGRDNDGEEDEYIFCRRCRRR